MGAARTWLRHLIAFVWPVRASYSLTQVIGYTLLGCICGLLITMGVIGDPRSIYLFDGSREDWFDSGWIFVTTVALAILSTFYSLGLLTRVIVRYIYKRFIPRSWKQALDHDLILKIRSLTDRS
jgi:hypothetical protein